MPVTKNRRETNGTWAEAGDVKELPLNEPTELLFHKKRADGWKTTVEKTTAWAVKSENEVIAFAPQCTHLGCAYHWDKKNKNFLKEMGHTQQNTRQLEEYMDMLREGIELDEAAEKADKEAGKTMNRLFDKYNAIMLTEKLKRTSTWGKEQGSS